MTQALVDVIMDSDCGGEHLAIENGHKASLLVESIAGENIAHLYWIPDYLSSTGLCR